MSSMRRGPLLLLLFLCSGFSGLVYQSAWSHYLGLTLGHAAYAQSLVLAIFMGGMALGAWAASRLGIRSHHLLAAYALLEAAIGIAGLAFHPLFTGYMALTTDVVLPRLHSVELAHAWQWTGAALLIAPQCILLGATFPVLSAACMRLAPAEAGPILGGLYFSNSFGAALGALATAFLLLPAVGMPGSMAAAGALNLVVAAGAWLLSRGLPADAALARTAAREGGEGAPAVARTLMLAAGITGATSFVYEIGWVRMLNQALGTTLHAFELMLAAFILGLAFGGLWVRRRTRRDTDAIALAGHAQWLMGAAALLSIPVFNQSFRWMGWLMQHLARDDAGYAWFSAGSGLVAMLVMFPAAFFAGMTLPLFTLALLRRGSGEAGIGRIYAANTLGAIVGVFAMVHVLVPLFGIRLSVTLAAVLDILLGLYLLRAISPGRATRGYAVAAAAAAAALLASLQLGRPDPQVQTAGVFRTGHWRRDDLRVAFLRDGKTATVSVSATPDATVANISTNGKPDASLATRLDLAPLQDEATMVMAGALPLVFHPAPRRVAVIGWGSGLTTHTLLGSPVPQVVDSIEIERAMYDGARLFGPRVARAYADPRSRVHIDDARTWFATGNLRYDVIVSEPSNPWVSGVSSLFTQQFYGFVHGHLSQDGLLVQWVQSYELTDALLGTMVAALLDRFPDTDVYVTNTSDLLMVARRDRRHAPDWSRLGAPALRAELARVGLDVPEGYGLRRIGGGDTLRNLVLLSGARPHSDYFPTVALDAPRARFKRERADFLIALVDCGLPVQELLGERMPPPAATAAVPDLGLSLPVSARARAIRVGQALAARKVDADLRARWPGHAGNVERLLALSAAPITAASLPAWSLALVETSESLVAALPAADVAGVFEQPAWLARGQALPQVARLLAMEAAVARRDPAAMRRTATEVLAGDDGVAMAAREHALVVAMLGAIASGRPGDAPLLERRYGAGIPPSLLRGRLRSWLLAWADAHPVPAARALQAAD